MGTKGSATARASRLRPRKTCRASHQTRATAQDMAAAVPGSGPEGASCTSRAATAAASSDSMSTTDAEDRGPTELAMDPGDVALGVGAPSVAMRGGGVGSGHSSPRATSPLDRSSGGTWRRGRRRRDPWPSSAVPGLGGERALLPGIEPARKARGRRPMMSDAWASCARRRANAGSRTLEARGEAPLLWRDVVGRLPRPEPLAAGEAPPPPERAAVSAVRPR
ncbi:hypothetical protein ACKKBG_A00405 [Auxenochlorella protothecoides x Auxenochlorella symbiontica]